MDSQTESANRVIKNYLHMYIAYTQDNWVNHLPMKKFVASNQVNALIGMTLFFVDYEFHPHTSIEPFGMFKDEQKVEPLAASKIVV